MIQVNGHERGERAMTAGTRQRMIESAAQLLRDGGLGAANFSDVLARSGAARGAIYHHFPEGKNELTRAAVSWTGHRVRANFEALRGDDPSQVVAAFIESVRPVVAEASSGTSCAVAAVVLEAGQREALLTETAHAALRSWIEALTARLVAAGAVPSAARQVAVLLITFLEGTQVLCRAAGDLAAFDDASAAIATLISTSLTPTAGPTHTRPSQ